MPGYGPQNEEYYANEKAKFDKKYPPGVSKPKRSGPSRIVAKPPQQVAAASNGGEVIVEEVEVPVSSGGQRRQYITPNYQQHVFIALGLSLIMVLLAAKYRGDNAAKTSSQFLDPKSNPANFVAGWVGLSIVLMAMASFRGTDKLAAAFAWLIFTAVLLINGEQGFAAAQHFFDSPSTTPANDGRGSGTTM